ncbi:FabD/lysophospholipase-like protein [Patellaria atrata CBS 101060]|uniref:[acyl-carrier-protein] S-malonyltransferase n=1 Tax=Patellaria atrata CBS 101060 TaxID=1346257 RepID=A0A9P4SD68_9PEZI|nr:FabD/lysophospholipase-like protein [Patellaria atrata CBS 101060]
MLRKPQTLSSLDFCHTNQPHTTNTFLPPGQGVQKVGMLTPWATAYPRTVKPLMEEVDTLLGFSLTKVIAEGPNAALTATQHSQPAIMATSIIILRVLEQEFGFHTQERVDITLGHSLGEFAALVAGGYLTFEDALRILQKRAEAMAECSRKAVEDYGGEVGMVALILENESRLAEFIDGVYEFLLLSSQGSKYDSAMDVPPVEQVMIANINSKNQIVLSGSIERIKTLLTHLRQFGGHDPRHVRLKSDSPFHSSMMKPAQDVMRRLLEKKSQDGEDIIRWPGIMPCVSNVSARPFNSREQLKDLLARQCVETVRWWDSVKYLHQEVQIRRWIGIGPGKVGRNLVGKEVGMKGAVKGGGVWGITSPQEAEEVMKALDETEQAEED